MDYQIIRSKRKTLSLQINQNAELVIRAPLYLGGREIQAFIDEKSSWIEKKQQQVKSQISEKHGYHNGEIFLYLGNEYPLSLDNIEKVLVFNGNEFLLNKGCGQKRNSFEQWYKQQFSEVALPRIDYFAKKHNLKFNEVRIKKQKTLWGSCSSSNNLNFNYLLMMAPMSVIDYVIVHELSHTIHKDHSKKFWALVVSILPEYKLANKWLRDNGHKLRSL